MQRITYTQGNTFSVSVPMIKKMVEKVDNVTTITTEDFIPEEGDIIDVRLIGERRQYRYTPTIEGNVAVFVCAGNELAGRYGIEVNVLCANGERMRFADPHAIELVPYTGIMDNFVVGSVELGASVFFAMRGEKGDKGDPGEDGVGISSITKVSTQGLVDTYAITYTDGTSTTFQVTNGAKGEQGAPGTPGTPGAAGADGVSVSSIVQTTTSTASGGINIVTVTLSNGATSTFEIRNGAKGDPAEQLIVYMNESGGTYILDKDVLDIETALSASDDIDCCLIWDGNIPEVVSLKCYGYNIQETIGGLTHNVIVWSGDDDKGNAHVVRAYYDADSGNDVVLYDVYPLRLPLVEVSGTTPTQTLAPNTFYKFTGAVTSLTLTLGTPTDGIANIYAFSFVAGADNPTISLPASVTIDGTPSIAQGDYVEFSIMNNVAIFKVVTI